MEAEHVVERPKVSDYFMHNAIENQTKCEVGSCGQCFQGYVLTNMTNHLKSKHKEIYATVEPTKSKRKGIDDPLEKVRLFLLEMVTLNGRPFKCVNDSGLQKIIALALASHAKENKHCAENKTVPTNVISKNMLLNDLACGKTHIQNIIAREVQGKAVSLMIDAVKKHGKSFLGINLQFINDKCCLQLRSIGFKRMLQRHTGAYIAELILTTLKEYNIDINQVYSMTTDNGANVIKSVDEIRNTQRANYPDNSADDLDEIDQAILRISTMNDADLLECEEGETNEESLPTIAIETENFSDIMAQITNNNVFVPDINNIPSLYSILCGAHSLQLDINKAIQAWDEETGLLKKCRDIVTKLRTTNYRNLLIQQNLRCPVIENDTRWNSIYLMVSAKQRVNRLFKRIRIHDVGWSFSNRCD